MGNKTFHILAKKDLRLSFFYCAGKLKKERSPSIVKAFLISRIRKSLARKTARKKINFSFVRRKIDVVNIALDNFSIFKILPQGLTRIVVKLIHQNLIEPRFMQAKCKSACARKQFNRIEFPNRRYFFFCFP